MEQNKFTNNSAASSADIFLSTIDSFIYFEKNEYKESYSEDSSSITVHL